MAVDNAAMPSPRVRLPVPSPRWPPLLAALWAAWWLALWPAALAAQPLQRLTVADFAVRADGPWQPVALPDTWSARGVPRPGLGWYRLRTELPAAAADADAGTWALRWERVSSHHRLWLNGALLHDTLTQAAADPGSGRAQPVALLLHLPPGLLRAGGNELLLQVDSGLRAGLSAPWLGPAMALEPAHRRGLWLDSGLPQQLNLAAAGACGFALLLWWRRRSEAAMGWFGLLGLMVSLRNQAYHLPNPGLPPALSSLLFYIAQVVTVTLLGVFAMSLTRRRPRIYRPLLLAGAALMVLTALLASLTGHVAIDRLRAWSYPVLGLLALPALLLIGQRVRAMRGGELAALLLALMGVLLAGGHDYLFQRGVLDVGGQWWLPYATPMMVLAFCVLMVGRVVQAMTQVEVLNQTLELRVRERTQALAAANAAKTRFLAAASHDLRQPVVAIGLLVGLLREQITQPALRAMVVKVDEAVAAMESLLAGLLDLSRLDSGSVRPQLLRVPLQPLLDAVAVHEAEAARHKGLTLRVRPSACAVWADPLLLEQVLRNLVSNAVRYTDRGGVLVGVRPLGGGRLRLQVWDTGRGIAPAQQAEVFEEFVQLDNPQRERSQGLGLGLAIVRRSAELMGARLTLRSVPGRGSCFGIELPVAEGDLPPPAPVPAAERWLAGMRVVLVEDDPAVRDALVARLVAWGAAVQAHAGPRALREALDAQPPDGREASLLITDLRLPGGSGWDVLSLARRRYGAWLPVLVITGNTAPADLAALAGSGLPVLHKPFRAEDLRAALAAALAAPVQPGAR